MGLLSPYYGSTAFDGVSFFEQGAHYPGMDVETEGTLYNLGGGVHTYVDMGQAPGIFELSVGAEGTQAAALISKRGDTGTLVWSRGSQTATLLDIIPTEADVAGFDSNTYTLRFFSDDMPAEVTPSGAFLTEGGDTFITEGGDTFVTE